MRFDNDSGIQKQGLGHALPKAPILQPAFQLFVRLFKL